MMHRNRSVDVHNFAMVPRAEIPRSSFSRPSKVKTAFNASFLIPFYLDEMVPGDTFNVNHTSFVRLATPIFPTMDNLHFKTFYFACPMRLLWSNFVRMMGERDPDPDSSIDFEIPHIDSPNGGYAVGSLPDYMGIPTTGQIGPGSAVRHSALPMRMYNLVWNEWFRDQNLQDSVDVPRGDGPDSSGLYNLRRINKKHDYFTSGLPWTQKGDPVSIPLGTSAPVLGIGIASSGLTNNPVSPVPGPKQTGGVTTNFPFGISIANATQAQVFFETTTGVAGTAFPNIRADLSAATAVLVNTLRTAFQMQRLLERDARGGTRYTEVIRAHFGVNSPDARLQRPEYIGGSVSQIVINPIAQTSATSVTGTDTPQGNLAAVGTGLNRSGFSYSATEHMYVMGLMCVVADLTYQQGLERLWSRSTRYDFLWPVFTHLGEQEIRNKEIFVTGSATDDQVFAYQERYGEYRYKPSQITGLMRSTASGTIDPWHYAQEFSTLPLLNETFIQDGTREVLERTTAVGDQALGQQLIADIFIDCKAARPLPMYGVPGLIDHL